MSKEEELKAKMDSLGIREEDILEKFIKGTGAGGQKINKTSSCVYLKHLPSGIEVKCQRERSRELNRFLAKRELVDKIEEMVLGIASKKRQEIEKIRRQKRKRSKRAKEKMLQAKHLHSDVKKFRQKPCV